MPSFSYSVAGPLYGRSGMGKNDNPWPTNVPSVFDSAKPQLHCALRKLWLQNITKLPTGTLLKSMVPMLAKVCARDVQNQADLFWRGCEQGSPFNCFYSN
jgi:hypothetical protein